MEIFANLMLVFQLKPTMVLIISYVVLYNAKPMFRKNLH